MASGIPSLTIFYPYKGKAGVVVVHHAPLFSKDNKSMASTYWGKLDCFSLESFGQAGVEIILASLAGYNNREVRLGTPNIVKSEFELLSKSELQKIKRDKIKTNVSLRQNKEIWLCVENPGSQAFKVVLSPGADSSELMAKLRQLASLVKPSP